MPGTDVIHAGHYAGVISFHVGTTAGSGKLSNVGRPAKEKTPIEDLLRGRESEAPV
jgi:hypothetical protein